MAKPPASGPPSYGQPSLASTRPQVEPPPHIDASPERGEILPIAERLHSDPRFSGKSVTAAFLDSGFYAHPDLMEPRTRIRAYHDLINDKSGVELIGAPDASSWHGMMTSAVAAGNGHLSGGRFKSLAPEMDVVFVKVGHMARVRHDDIARGIRWVVEHQAKHGIRILNISAGGDYEASYLADNISRAAEDAVRAGIVVVCAVGNAGRDPNHRVFPPASTPAVITVGGVDDDGDPRRGRLGGYYSSFGPTIDGLQKPEIVAPAIWLVAPILPQTPTAEEADLLTVLAQASDEEIREILGKRAGVVPALDAIRDERPYLVRQVILARLRDQKVISGSYKHVDGSSFAAPIVTSIVAQMLEANPALTPHDVKRILIDTARRLPGIAVERQGWGVVHPAAAVQLAVERKK